MRTRALTTSTIRRMRERVLIEGMAGDMVLPGVFAYPVGHGRH